MVSIAWVVIAAVVLLFVASFSRRARRLLRQCRARRPNTTPSVLKQRNEAWMRADIKVASCEAGYRRLTRLHLRETDGVVELGCHCGTTTALARSLCRGRVVGIDTSTFNLAKAQEEHAGIDVEWMQADATDASAVRRALLGTGKPQERQPLDTRGVEVVLLDISGSRAPGTLLEVISKYDAILAPRLFIVKSYKLFSFISKASIEEGGARWSGDPSLLDASP